jgi:catechol 2,3-dioxygenase
MGAISLFRPILVGLVSRQVEQTMTLNTDSSADIRSALRVPLSMSHVGLYVHYLQKMEDFYTRVLGFTVTDRGKVRGADIVFTSWDPKDHHQVALVGGRPKELAFNHINQISFRVTSVEELQAIWQRVKNESDVRDMRPIDHGNAWSLYFLDPEGNRLEVFCDTEWYIAQPCLEDLNLAQPADQIRAKSEAFCRRAPGFKPIGQYRAELAEKMGLSNDS